MQKKKKSSLEERYKGTVSYYKLSELHTYTHTHTHTIWYSVFVPLLLDLSNMKSISLDMPVIYESLLLN